MRQKNTFLLLGLVLTVLLLGVAYAAIESVTLNINGTIQATPDQANFKVAFSGTPTSTGDGTTIVNITGDTTASIQVSGLSSVGQKAVATFNITNSSSDITAYISETTTNSNTEYFRVTSELSSTAISAGGTTETVKVTIELIKTPLTAQTANITVGIIASPYADDNGGTSGNTTEGNTTWVCTHENATWFTGTAGEFSHECEFRDCPDCGEEYGYVSMPNDGSCKCGYNTGS